jgi:hypothetical protein
MMAHCHCLLLLKHKEDKTHKKIKKKTQEKGGSLLLSSRFAFSLLALASTLLFQRLSLNIFFFSRTRKERKTKKKKM